MFESEALPSYNMNNLFPPFAHRMVRPDFSSAVEELMKPPLMEERDQGHFPCYRDYIKQALNYDGYREKYFQVNMNINQFKPSDVVVKKEEDYIVIHAKHELKPDPHGYVTRGFTRRVKIPNNVLLSKIKCTFNRNGLLTIKALQKQKPKKSEVELLPADDFIEDKEKELE